jgi:homoserine/homoserine lactone efflux protein
MGTQYAFRSAPMVLPVEIFAAYLLACIVVVIVPGPSVTVIIANALAGGRRAGLLSVAGTQAGLALMLGVLLAGLATVVETMAWWFDWVRLAGAAYLVWLGFKLVRARGEIGAPVPVARSGRSYFWQGLLVVLANPKALLFFGAFIPQFIDPAGDVVAETVTLGLTFMVVALVLDGGYALLAGSAGQILSATRVRLLSRVSGLLLMGGGVWLATLRR